MLLRSSTMLIHMLMPSSSHLHGPLCALDELLLGINVCMSIAHPARKVDQVGHASGQA